jgi:hypothetical protein
VSVEDVLDLVRQDSGQLLGTVGALEEPTEDDDGAAGRGEGVHHRMVDDGHAKGIARVGQRAQQDRHDLIDALLAGC